ncbi:MAG: L-aspartate oxidase, partial [Dehalococcoidia bacterium]
SNSLLETVVFAKRAVEQLFEGAGTPPPEPSPDARSLPRREDCVITPELPETAELRELMWAKAGIVRTRLGLAEAAERLAEWESLMPPAHDRAAMEMRSMIICGRLMTEAAMLREESRGAHFRSDFPEPSEEWRRHLVFRR